MKLTEEKIAYVLRQAESGTPVTDVAAAWGFQRRRSTSGRSMPSLGVTEPRNFCQLEEENTRLKRLVADLTLDRHMLQEVIRRSEAITRVVKGSLGVLKS
jgi:putative transposase